ncbi:Transcriptional regulator-like protein [Mycoavidus cysteinexigens]|uniref:Transcriptional regulator-like protein n=1 Tax=Mycoavidus cysteinexigens TaxID=1553431 RepID=A0A2Z6ET98_9BURK|nr:hypothetical protein [Mycoavidus cysteinexigens]BBE08602.1 Transcriptional regulator-like protein [Mycoavidus cysteinexigens]GAM52696.1 hypothetical protein EBME_1159 [bacterium endosymbiont of Mortierella elongata FMR23-6]GLR01534.1 hypothetical protein GCM10007934_13460 [Mycoavidus cysteinexigens]
MGAILNLVPLDKKKAKEVEEALRDLLNLVQQGAINGLIFQFRTHNGEHFHGLAGHYRKNLVEAIGSLGCLKMRLIQVAESTIKRS